MPEFDSLAINGGDPVRRELLPYARQTIDDDDIRSVLAALQSPWLTTGPVVDEFERVFAHSVGSQHAVAVNSGTAALHSSVFALGIGPGDEVIVPALTFVATANCVAFQGAKPIFADVNRNTLLLDADQVAHRLTSKTRAVIAVDYAGQPCNYDSLNEVVRPRGIPIIADACHAFGARHRGRPVGSLADLSTFSFHPAKHVTTAEGGMVTTGDSRLAERLRIFRNHGITTDHRQRAECGSWTYEMVALGFNYRLSDVQCALGISQMRKAQAWLERRREIAAQYTAGLEAIAGVEPLQSNPDIEHAYHLFVVRLADVRLAGRRDEIFAALRAEGIGVNVHYMPVHLHPFYIGSFGCRPGDCPVAENEFRRILSLPMFPAMTDADVRDVLDALAKTASAFVKA